MPFCLISEIIQSRYILNIILLTVNNFDIKLEKAWNICFIICHQHQIRSDKIKVNKAQQMSGTTQVFL